MYEMRVPMLVMFVVLGNKLKAGRAETDLVATGAAPAPPVKLGSEAGVADYFLPAPELTGVQTLLENKAATEAIRAALSGVSMIQQSTNTYPRGTPLLAGQATRQTRQLQQIDLAPFLFNEALLQAEIANVEALNQDLQQQLFENQQRLEVLRGFLQSIFTGAAFSPGGAFNPFGRKLLANSKLIETNLKEAGQKRAETEASSLRASLNV